MICFISTFLIKDQDGERNSKVAFRVCFASVVLSSTAEALLFPTVIDNALGALALASLTYGLLWRAHSLIPDWYVVFIALLFFILISIYPAYSMLILVCTNALLKLPTCYALWYRTPNRNNGDLAIAFLLLFIVVVGIANILIGDYYEFTDLITNYSVLLTSFLGGLGMFILCSYLLDAHLKLEQRARTDPLTNLNNRRGVQEDADKTLTFARRHQTPTALAMCDLDKFKSINDIYGHKIGDDVIVKFSEILKTSVRDIDILARVGGEEFVIIFPKTEIGDAYDITERIRKNTERAEIRLGDATLKFTASFGLTSINYNDDFQAAIQASDSALYEAKSKGRNRVALFKSAQA
jgi:diguanylate cyclase (GGDEF)-like protein